ncbi:TonB-dependent receptor domain-containing protein [Thalassotalea montiporae]
MNIKHLSKLAVAIGAAITVNANVYAQTPSVADEEVITVTGSRSPVNIDTALASVVVITREDIARIQPKSLDDVLDTIPGIDITNQGGRGQNSSLFLRGTNSNQTLVLIDGIRVSSASLGSTNTQIIAPELIDRIEVVKGPRAAIWGSDAIGGVIQIFTRQLEGSEYIAGVTVGADDYRQYKAGAGIAHPDGKGHTSITLNREKSDGFDVLKTAEDDNDGYEYDSVAIKGQQQVNSQLAIDWLARADQGDNEYDNAFGGANEAETRNHAWLVRGTYSKVIGHVQNHTTLSIGQNRDYSENYLDGTDAFTTVFETRRDQFSLVNHAQVFPFLQFNLGFDYYNEQLNSTTDFAEDERDVTAFYAHSLYSKNDLTVEAAVRHDDVENVDSETTYNAGIGYQINEDTRIALNAGSGFKAPSFNDLYFPASQFSSGNPDLQSETSDTIELVFETNYANVDMAFNLYQTDVDNLIVWLPDANFFFQPTNVNEAEMSGIEFTAKYQGFGGNHQINAGYVDAEDKATGEQLIRRAKDQFSYQFDTNIGDLSLYVEYQYRGEREDNVFGVGRVKLDSYHLVNLTASYPVTANLSVESRITNAFNENYETAVNYNTQDRAAYIGINYAM